MVENALSVFRGQIEQTPPMYVIAFARLQGQWQTPAPQILRFKNGWEAVI
jgi:hypothetical protein